MAWTVRDVMTTDVVTVDPDTNFKDCVNLLRLHGISALPVVNRDGLLLGIVSEFDLLTKEAERGAKPSIDGIGRRKRRLAAGRTAAYVMTSPAIATHPDASIAEAARLMHRERVKRLPVIDDKGKLIGITSRFDLLKPFMRSDESIRKEVVDQVLSKVLVIDPKALDVEVRSGLVSLGGQLETKSLADLVIRLVESVEGTVGVDSKLTWKLDDTHLGVELPPGALQLSADERSS